jgi:tRNA isopentenyl-2-thiomethyl-A-37 hydroxylase MiaE
VDAAFIGATAAIGGILLGGGVRAWEADRARKRDAESLLAALVAEVEALVRLMDHRKFLEAITACGFEAFELVQAGRAHEPANFLTISLRHNYFVIYEASTSKIGLLHPYMADRIARFYTYVKAVSENYDPTSPFQQGVTAQEVVQIVENDVQLLQTALVLGRHIATFHKMAPPAGIVDPFVALPQQEPALPRT